MRRKSRRAIAGAAGMAVLQGMAVVSPAFAQTSTPAQDGAAVTEAESVAVTKDEAEKEYKKIANVEGEFAFDQMQLSPSDSVFSLFGTVATAACATPSFALENPQVDGSADYYINIGGTMQKAASVPLSELKKDGKADTLKCSCGMSSSIVNAEVVGVPLASIVEMNDLSDEINAVTVRGADGYGVTLTLDKAVNGGGMLVYKVAGTDLDTGKGGPVQLWMPGAAASYFTRQVTDIEFFHTDDAIAEKEPNAEQRAKISIQNTFEGTFSKGDVIAFEGYADDYDVPVAAVEFSMDGGNTWTRCETENTSTSKWVYWHFAINAPQEEGDYRLDARCVTADGKVSPLASSVQFTVTDGATQA